MKMQIFNCTKPAMGTLQPLLIDTVEGDGMLTWSTPEGFYLIGVYFYPILKEINIHLGEVHKPA
jgi:hypothetical protein